MAGVILLNTGLGRSRSAAQLLLGGLCLVAAAALAYCAFGFSLEDLVNYAVEVDGSDNATAQVIAIRSVEAMAMYRGRLYPRAGG